MIGREQIIKKYFEAWLIKNGQILKDIFTERTVYSECYGPEYNGIEVVKRWFKDWNKHGTVLLWNIKQFIHQGNMTAVEWYFKCEYEGSIEEFNGVSLIEFDKTNHIVSLKEFQSKIPHYYPYT